MGLLGSVISAGISSRRLLGMGLGLYDRVQDHMILVCAADEILPHLQTALV